MPPNVFSVHAGGMKAGAMQLTCTKPSSETGTAGADLHSTVPRIVKRRAKTSSALWTQGSGILREHKGNMLREYRRERKIRGKRKPR